MKKLVFITGNPAKAKYLSNYFNWPVEHKKLNIHEIQSLNLEEIVGAKAKEAYKIIKKPVLVEDVSLVFKELKSLPGPLIKWFLETLGNGGLCRMLNGENREAVAKVAFCYFDGKMAQVFSAQRRGSISQKPRGKMGFGWDPIFIPHGFNKTWAEMNDDEKYQSSMRKIALKRLKKFLEKR